MNTDSNEYVSILVPKKALTRIYGFIASLDEDAGPVQERQGATEAENVQTTTWSPQLIERQYRESPDSMKQFQQYLAAHPGEKFSTSEMATALNAERGWNTVAGVLGAYGRRIKNRYQMSSPPFARWWEHAEGVAYFKMDEETAAIIRSL